MAMLKKAAHRMDAADVEGIEKALKADPAAIAAARQGR